MQYEITATVRLLIIAEIYGLTDAELPAAFKSATNPQETVDHAPAVGCSSYCSLAVPRQDGGKLVLFETSYGVRRCLEPYALINFLRHQYRGTE